ncbi:MULTISPECIES: hypothetical protein [Haloarcula]|uniref:hypothetical protein n=1 Tax=Haloarcula TaxID=2237 RepID=UPI0023E8FA6D|nr:hypothetical protein [Halomicroarcula sp. SHR3]
MSTELTWTVEVSDDEAEALAEFDDDRIQQELESTLSELASASARRDELHDRMNISADDDEELSGEALETEMRKYLRGERSDPRLD